MGFEKLINRVTIQGLMELNSSEEYYYILGQFVMYMFHSLGGSNNFKREINYLSNPNEPKRIFHLGKRNVRFISNYPKLIKEDNIYTMAIYSLLLDKQIEFINENINEQLCTEAFYEGLYGDNFLVQLNNN